MLFLIVNVNTITKLFLNLLFKSLLMLKMIVSSSVKILIFIIVFSVIVFKFYFVSLNFDCEVLF